MNHPTFQTLTSMEDPVIYWQIFRDLQNEDRSKKDLFRVRTPEGKVLKPSFTDPDEAIGFIKRKNPVHFPEARKRED